MFPRWKFKKKKLIASFAYVNSQLTKQNSPEIEISLLIDKNF